VAGYGPANLGAWADIQVNPVTASADPFTGETDGFSGITSRLARGSIPDTSADANRGRSVTLTRIAGRSPQAFRICCEISREPALASVIGHQRRRNHDRRKDIGPDPSRRLIR